MSDGIEGLSVDAAHVATLYARLDELREAAQEQFDRISRSEAGGTAQNRSERDALTALFSSRVASLYAVEERLAFGRLDLLDDVVRYVGRIGLADAEQAQLLIDWRAPAAQPFYQATAATPSGVVRRRHLTLRGREVVGAEDEVFDLDALDADARADLRGEGALMAAVTAHRTGRMGDIVATIQAEQDRIIRAELRGTLVVQGGPGTGKTAVALHRAAYLLYTHRERLERSGVLLIGPSPVFLRYIAAVLPSLGETGVVMATPGELYPGVTGVADEADEIAALKGDVRMAGVLAEAIRQRQRVPAQSAVIDLDGQRLVLRPQAFESARARARGTGRPHNLARVTFVRELLGQLASQVERGLRTRLGDEDRADVLSDLRDSRDVRRALNLAWMPLTPEKLLQDLFSRPDQLAAAAPTLTPAERQLLQRDPDAAWTIADVALLDEAAELLGEDDTAARLAAARDAAVAREEIRHAQDVMASGMAGMAQGMMTAEMLAGRFASSGPSLTVAERAEHDRTWAYGHVVVDEAQELSAMMWRLVARRCPSRSMTLVGDVAQSGSMAAASSWGQALDPIAAGRWRVEELSVNYRTPARIMAVAVDVLRAAGIGIEPPTSVREGTDDPVAQQISAGDLNAIVDAVRTELDLLSGGRLAVIVPTSNRGAVVSALADGLTGVDVGLGAAAIDARVAVLTVTESKGLEFDGVVLLQPAQILAASPRGANDLYVALTRPTMRLRVLHTEPLPPGFERMSISGVATG